MQTFASLFHFDNDREYYIFDKVEYLIRGGFINSGSIVAEVKIVVKGGNTDRFGKKPHPTDLSFPSKCSDVILCVEGKKFHVSTQILAHASSLFEVLFFGEFKESREKEIELKDVSAEEFLTILEMIYESGKIDGSNVEYLLKLADQFNIPKIMISAEEWLINWTAPNLPIHRKLRQSDQYNLYGLQEDCLRNIDSSKEATIVTNSDSFEHLSGGLKDKLIEKILEIKSPNTNNVKQRTSNIERLPKMPEIDFYSAKYSDVVFVVNGKNLHASKQKLFYGDSRKSEEKKIDINDASSEYIDHHDVLISRSLVLLEWIYDTRREIYDHNVECLVKLADRFKITNLMDRAHRWLIADSSLPMHSKLRLADQYKLEVLKGHCLRNISSYSDIKQLKHSASYKHYSIDIKDVLIKKLLDS